MSSYTKIKTATKVIIYLCCFMLLVAGGFYVLKKQSITADEQEKFNPVIDDKYQTAGGDNLTLEAPIKVHAGEGDKYKFNINYSTPNPTLPVTRVSLYIAEVGIPGQSGYDARAAKWSNINKERVCQEIHKSENIRELHLKGTSSPSDCKDGKCSGVFSNYISQPGEHRVIGIAMKSADTCLADGSNADEVILALNYNLTIKGVKEGKEDSDGSEGAGGAGGGIFDGRTPDPGNRNGYPNNNPGGNTPTGSGANKLNLKNPTVINSLTDLWNKISYWFSVLIGVFSFFAIIIAGFIYMSAGGDEQRATKAKKAIGYAIAGLVIATLSYAITLNYVRILNNISSGKDPSKVNEALVPTDKDDIQKAVEGISERAEP